MITVLDIYKVLPDAENVQIYNRSTNTIQYIGRASNIERGELDLRIVQMTTIPTETGMLFITVEE